MFATLGEQAILGWKGKIAVGTVSLLSAVLASIQTSLAFTARAEKHARAGVRFGALLKEIEQKTVSPPPDWEEWATDFRTRWTALSEESPTIPNRIWKKANWHVNKEMRARERRAGLVLDDEETAKKRRRRRAEPDRADSPPPADGGGQAGAAGVQGA